MVGAGLTLHDVGHLSSEFGTDAPNGTIRGMPGTGERTEPTGNPDLPAGAPPLTAMWRPRAGQAGLRPALTAED